MSCTPPVEGCCCTAASTDCPQPHQQKAKQKAMLRGALIEHDRPSSSWHIVDDSNVIEHLEHLVSGGALADFWSYDLAGNSWTQLSPSGAAPSGRRQHIVVLDLSPKKLTLSPTEIDF